MNISELREQKASGFRRLRFTPLLERAFLIERDKGLRARCRPVSLSALALLACYAGLDLAMLPPELARQTLMVRGLFTTPVILMVLMLSYQPISARLFSRCYTVAYLAGGLSVVIIIALARLQGVAMPYDGILLMLMFGYMVMGLPFRSVSLASLLILVAYLAMEIAVATPLPEVAMNGFFLATASIIGMVGAWLSEYRQRAHYLDRQLLALGRLSAERDNLRKTHLITAASHDLRQPLQVISLLLDNLRPERLPPDEAPLVARLKASLAHFNGLLASVLDLSRLQENMVIPAPADLSADQVLQNLANAVADAAAERGVVFTVGPVAGPVFRADPQLLHRVLQNLVLNSLEHSGASRIRVCALAQDGQIRFEVEDNGCGIDAQTRARVFEPFFRVSGQGAETRGLGLGLAIVRELTGLMAGQCGVSAGRERGCRFWVTLPAVTSVGPAQRTVTPAPATL
ncbi:MAG: HAMP domain-containing sensor histidine kinase [Marinobacter sp.]|uniref:sensor histidine kinase n=1 Tax=Marinobacter sp. TaxID=50741 RepID=UPI00299E2F4A|nr:HAMP domain-containing sensor histidine kinase [Marinobacter sp.]MDX1633585.1 HAMP domain-containing sensor histidine kinase [Marinobacter sp.]